MQVIFQMRYSYFGQSGWRSHASRHPEALFSEERLARRAYFLERIALASLAVQSNVDFKLVVLSSQGMPKKAKTALVETCNDMIGADRSHVIFRGPGHAGVRIRRYIHKHLNDAKDTLQVILDDDDAVSTDFVEVMRKEARLAQQTFKSEDDYCYLSQAQGLTADFAGDTVNLIHRTVPFNTQGLCLIGPTLTKRNPFFTAHKRLARNHPVRVLFGSEPYYIRAVHDTNDSRAMIGDKPVKDEELDAMIVRFPLLKNLLTENKRTERMLLAS